MDVGDELFIDEVGVGSFQVNTPFSGGALNAETTEYPLNDARLSRFLVSMGRPQKVAGEITTSYVAMSKGASAVLTEDVKKVLGRAPTPFSQVARDYAHLFK